MAYLNEDGLARYDGLVKQWVTLKSGTVDGIDPLLNWQKTETAASVAFYPLPAAPLDPVVNFSFIETGPASGEKAPDNPSTITGVSQAKVTRCGKNLIPHPYPQSSFVNHGYTATSNDDGSVIFNGESDGLSACHFNLVRTGTFLVKGGISYTAALYGVVNTGVVFQAWGADGRFVFSVWSGGQPATFTLNEDAYITMRVTATQTAGSLTNAVFRPQLELGSTATAFEPYEGADYAANLGGTFYGGSVDLSAGTMTVTHVCVELDGSYEFPNNSGGYNSTTGLKFFQGYGPSIFGTAVVNGSSVCSHFVNASCTAAGVEEGTITAPCFALAGTNGSQLRFAAPFSSADGFNGWLANQKTAGTPVLVTAALKNPTIVPLTPQQIYSLSQPDPYAPRINTVYSDQISVQVGYPKSPQATSTELTNAIVSLGGNI